MSETAEAMSLFRAVGLGLLLCKILPPQMPHWKNGIRPIEPSKGQGLLRPLHVCAVTRRRFPVGASPTRRTLQPEATGAVMEVTKWLKPSV